MIVGGDSLGDGTVMVRMEDGGIGGCRPRRWVRMGKFVERLEEVGGREVGAHLGVVG